MRVGEGLNDCVDKGKGGGGKIPPRFEEKGGRAEGANSEENKIIHLDILVQRTG